MVKEKNLSYLTSIFFISFCHGISCSAIFPEDGFRFNCGVDVCTFPLQYCDITNAGICKYCNKDLCNTDDVPQQCYTACTGKKSPVLNTVRSDERPESVLEISYQNANREKLNTIQEKMDTQFLMQITVITMCIVTILMCIAIVRIVMLHKKQLHRKFDKELTMCVKNDRKVDLNANNITAPREANDSDEEETIRNQGNPNAEVKFPLIEPQSENPSLLPNDDAEMRSSPDEITNASITDVGNVLESPESLTVAENQDFSLPDGAKSEPCGNTNPKIIERSLSSGSKSESNIKYPVEEENQTPAEGCFSSEPRPHHFGIDGCNKLSPHSLIDRGHFSEEKRGPDK